MTGALYSLARFCARHRYLVLSAWLIATVVLVGVSHQLGNNTSDNLTLPGTGSQQATDTLSRSFPDQANGSSPIVLHVSHGKLTDAKYADAVNQATADVAKAPLRGVGGQPAHLAGCVRAQQGSGDRVPVGDVVGQPGGAVRE